MGADLGEVEDTRAVLERLRAMKLDREQRQLVAEIEAKLPKE